VTTPAPTPGLAADGHVTRAAGAFEPFIVAAGHVVTPSGFLTPGWLRVDSGRIEAMGEGEPPEPATYHARWALPGFIDMHVHGGGGGCGDHQRVRHLPDDGGRDLDLHAERQQRGGAGAQQRRHADRYI